MVGKTPKCGEHAAPAFPSWAALPQVGEGSALPQRQEDPMPVSKNIDVEALKRDYASGLSTPKIGEKYDISSSTVAYHLNKAGVEMRQGGPGNRAAISKAAAKTPRQNGIAKAGAAVAEPEPLPASPNGHARCRVAMFEVEGSPEAVMAAVAAVRAALEHRG